jgi:putative transposase
MLDMESMIGTGKAAKLLGVSVKALTLRDRQWSCGECGAHHDRDLNAARNLKRLATATALPVASLSSNGGTASGMVPVVVGKVTPVRDELAVGRSGQEENRAHFCALS